MGMRSSEWQAQGHPAGVCVQLWCDVNPPTAPRTPGGTGPCSLGKASVASVALPSLAASPRTGGERLRPPGSPCC